MQQKNNFLYKLLGQDVVRTKMINVARQTYIQKEKKKRIKSSE